MYRNNAESFLVERLEIKIMSNNWNIPGWLEVKVRDRDKNCVYCHVKLTERLHKRGAPSDKATFEHIDNDGPPSKVNIALCCAACNSSKGAKKLLDWFNSSYCRKKNICKETTSDIIQNYIETI